MERKVFGRVYYPQYKMMPSEVRKHRRPATPSAAPSPQQPDPPGLQADQQHVQQGQRGCRQEAQVGRAGDERPGPAGAAPPPAAPSGGDPGCGREIPGRAPHGRVVAGPVACAWGGELPARAVVDEHGAPVGCGAAAAPLLGRVPQGPLHVAHAVQLSVPAEVGVAKDVGGGAQACDARGQGVAAHRLGQVGVVQHALLWQQALVR